jgi:sigma-E factor negative regulatory protein RseC
MCQVSEGKERFIEVPVHNPEKYSVGQDVNIVMQESLGLKAVFLAYIMPLVVCLVVMFGLSLIYDNELIFGGGAILAAVLYFLGLRRFTEKLEKVFVWYLE